MRASFPTRPAFWLPTLNVTLAISVGLFFLVRPTPRITCMYDYSMEPLWKAVAAINTPAVILGDRVPSAIAKLLLSFEQFESIHDATGVGFLKIYFSYYLIILLPLIAIFWRLVCFEASGRGRSRLAPLSGQRPLYDFLFVFFGGVPLLCGVEGAWQDFRMQLTYSRYECYLAFTYASFLLWGVMLVAFYGRDLYLYLRERRRLPPESSDARVRRLLLTGRVLAAIGLLAMLAYNCSPIEGFPRPNAMIVAQCAASAFALWMTAVLVQILRRRLPRERAFLQLTVSTLLIAAWLAEPLLHHHP